MKEKFDSRLNVLGINFPFLVAPMVGLSHVAFRELLRFYTPSQFNFLRFTEMLSTRRIPGEKLETTHQLRTAKDEAFFVPQLLGNDEKYIRPSIEKLMQLNPWGFDINMGCPVSHTLKHNWGVRLMGDKTYAAQVARITKSASPVPVSVKLRGGAGEECDLSYLLEFTESLEDAGVDWLTIHPRPRAAGHKGEANWSLVGEVRKARSIPVVANGNIQCAEDALFVMREYNVDGVMIARAATARPWILWQIAYALGCTEAPIGREGQRPPQGPEEEGKEFIASCLKFIELLEQYFSEEEFVLERFRFHAATASKWFQFGHAFWKMSMKCKSPKELKEKVFNFGEQSENPMYERVKLI